VPEAFPISDVEADLQTLEEIAANLPAFEVLDLQSMFAHFNEGVEA
jgi:hypothetical protein